jgi:hypothetical protein
MPAHGSDHVQSAGRAVASAGLMAQEMLIKTPVGEVALESGCLADAA